MPADRLSEQRLAPTIGHLEGAEVLGEPLVEPQRRVRERAVEQQVGELVEDDGEGLLASLDVHRDVVDVGAVDKEAVNGNRAAIGERHERSIRPRVRKDNDDDRRASGAQGCRQQLRDDFAKLFESKRDLAQAAGGDVADDVKVIRAKRTPLRRRMNRGSEQDRRRQEKSAPHDVRQRITAGRARERWEFSVRGPRT